ncbi:hypothetical protein OG539_32750 [Actinacidiphila glaucinigra]|uniref:hypothetical protein n=1 Tax=Actinacidiphila glaucinigra TaxID=235986 RepID=UPI003249B60D
MTTDNLLRLRWRFRHTQLMSTVVTVQADTEQECARLIARACQLLDLVPSLGPLHTSATGRWMARATVNDATPADSSSRGRPV